MTEENPTSPTTTSPPDARSTSAPSIDSPAPASTPDATPTSTPTSTPAATPDATIDATPDATPDATIDATIDATPHGPADTATSTEANEIGAQTSSVVELPEEEPEWRYWPPTHNARMAVVASWIVFAAYWLAISIYRFAPMFDRWACDGDQPQAVWQYWRYHVDGAFPPGDLLTDYAFVMHAPPVWWALMASLSSIVTPIDAAKILNVIAYLGAFALLYVVVARRSNHFVALAAIFLMTRGFDFHGQISGGYARSFGPLLVLLFLLLFMRRNHLGALASLVFAAAFYPSVVIPCGIAYGIYVVLAGPTMRERIKRVAGMTVTGVLIIAFGKYQDVLAPKWWGPVVSLDEAKNMPAWHAGGRVAEYPLRPLGPEFASHAVRGFTKAGHLLSPWLNTHFMRVGGYAIPIVVMLGAIGFLWWKRRDRLRDALPFELPLLAFAAFCSYLIARFFAYKLYLPYRPLQHTYPYLFYIALPLGLYCIFRNTRPLQKRMQAGLAAFALAVVPAFILCGDGWQPSTNYWTNVHDAPLFEFVRGLPIDKQLAGQIYVIDREPLFGYHRAYITRNLAHPFRAGYYKEAERRIRVVYTALYANDRRQFVDTMKAEHIDYFLYNMSAFKESDRRVFQPVKRDIDRIFSQNKKKGFALEDLPDSVYAFKSDTWVLDVQKLSDALDRGEIDALPPVPEEAAAPVLGPQPERPATLKAPGTLLRPDLLRTVAPKREATEGASTGESGGTEP